MPDPSGPQPDPGASMKARLRKRARAITLAYAAFAGLWIYFSDAVLAAIVPDAETLVRMSVYKGLAFVAVTSLLLFVVVSRAFRRIEEGYTTVKERERERRALQLEAERVGRLYAALSAVNQAIVRTSEGSALLQHVCDALVDHGGFRTAWVGWRDPVTERIDPAAIAGYDEGYFEAIDIFADDRPEGLGPTGLAFRSGEPYVCNDVSADPSTRLWREEAEKRNYRGCGSFPIRVGGTVSGVLSVYSDDTGFFRSREVELLVEVARDISVALDALTREASRKETEEAARRERRFSDAMTESMPGILYLYTAEGKFLRWNHRFEEVSGYSGSEIARMHPIDFFAPEHRPLLAERIGEVFQTGTAFVEASFLSKDGSTTPYLFTGRAVHFEGRECLVGIGIDVSGKKQAEEKRRAAERALRDLNRTLEQKVADRTEELRTALVRAESADRLKSAFLATMSHELRTPLNSIIGFTGIVLQELAGPLTGEQRKQLVMVQGSTRHLLELIKDVLDLSKIEAGQLEIRREAFDVAQVVEQAAETVRPLAEAKGLRLDVSIASDLGTAHGDPRRTHQILLNLLNNGIKFTDEGHVSLNAERENGSVTVRIADTGIGIKPEDLDLLFQPFRQVDSELTRQHEGTGLGLAICRRLATLMGGEISVESAWREGSEFSVTLPLDNGA